MREKKTQSNRKKTCVWSCEVGKAAAAAQTSCCAGHLG